MASNIRITIDEGRAAAYEFVLADDLYLFFQFESPKSKCEIAIAYDEYVDGGDWYVNSGVLGSQDHQLVSDVVFDMLPATPEFADFENAVDTARRRFNGVERR